ncbi:MAG: aminoacyl-tRNA hydrolase [Bacilli bacterium]|nr:aminoacyl-tRNA hydrolase [Bacilli bacterium]
MKLIVGLGNPGKEYENTRHNAGFRFLDTFAKSKNIDINKEKYKGLYATYNYNGEKVILLKPQKFMNLSGEVVKAYMDFFKITPEDILVIVDDLDTMIGHLKLKYKGSSGGHNGLKNIEINIKTKEYKRVKIGISNNMSKDKIDYVIGKVSKQELDKLNSVNKYAEELIDDFLTMNFDNVMNKYNSKDYDSELSK